MSAVETLLQEEAKLANCKESIDNGIVKEESDDSAVHSGDDEIGKNSNSPILLIYPTKESEDKEQQMVSMSEQAGSDKKIIKVKDGNELVFIQENLFSVTIIPPGVKPFEIQVSPQEIVQELHHLLMDHETTCHRTCFSLQLNGVKLDNFSELKSVQELTNGCEIKVVEEPYSLLEAKAHLRHVRDLLNALEFEEAQLGAEGHSLSYLNIITHGDVSAESIIQSEASSPSSSPTHTPSSRSNSPNNKKEPNTGTEPSDESKQAAANKLNRYKTLLSMLPKSVNLTDLKPPEHVLPGIKDNSLTYMHPENTIKVKSCLKILTPSMWNPPPSNRKLHGDLMYLYIVTLEDKYLHVTSSCRGFFVNQSDFSVFNPKPENSSQPVHSLIDLLMDVSPGFRSNFPVLNRVRCSRHLFERVGTPFQLHPWTSPATKHKVNHVHAEDSLSNRLSVEEHIPGQATRDWNEELAATRELSKNTLPERLLRERAMFKAHCDFVAAATKGAVMVIDRNIMPINPGEDRKMQMFIWNNIFFSLGFDVKDHYKELGGDHAAFYAPIADLNGLRAYQAVDAEGLHTLGTVVVDYRGFRVTAQSIIPGILEREQEQSIVYGSIDFGKTVLSCKEYEELVDKVAKPLRQLKHSIVPGEDENKIVELQTSVECKGITGNDGRRYLLDLLRTFPPDVNFLSTEESELLPECKKLGFPKKHTHCLAALRPELVEAFAEQKYVEFMQNCATQIFALRKQPSLNGTNKPSIEGAEDSSIKKSDIEESGENNRTLIENDPGQLHKSVVREAARKAGSCTDDEFDLRFNPDVFTKHLKFADSKEEIESQKNLIKEAAEFLVATQIPNFIRDCSQQGIIPVDGQSLTDSLHDRGIGARYLGKIIQLLPETSELTHVRRICTMELLSRSVRHILRMYLQSVSQTHLASAIAYFLSCLLGACKTPSPAVLEHETSRKKKRNRKTREFLTEPRKDWNKLNPQTLWQQLQTETKDYFDYELKETSIEEFFEKYKIQRVSMLRNVCTKNGIQILARDYDFENKHKPTFTEDDILDVYPLVKHVPPRASDAYQFYASGQVKIQQGYLKNGTEYITESLSLFNNVYGAMHLEIASCYRSVARLNYITGDYTDAVSNQQKAVIMFERVLGIDHVTTMFGFVNLAIYCFANSQIHAALQLLYRARYIMLVMYGDDHPDMAQISSTIGLVLHGLQEYDLSLNYLLDALRINEQIGKQNFKTALSYHLVARAYSCKGNFRQALHNEKQTYKLYQTLLGDDHEKTKESAEFLRHLTQQAVNLQRTMNEIYKKGSKAAIPPLQIMPPSLNSVLDLINAINGILKVVPATENKPSTSTEMDLEVE